MDSNICEKYCYRVTRGCDSSFNVKSKMGNLKLVVFDMDGVLTDIDSSWKYVHDFFNTSNEKSVEEYLRGKIDDLEFIRRDVSLWRVNGKPLKKEKLVEILSRVPIMKGAEDVVGFLKKHNVRTGIVSAGLDILADRVAREVGIDFVYANGVKTNRDGFLTGEGLVGVRLMYKDDTVKRLSKEVGVHLHDIAVVGNSCFDIPMFEVAGIGIAFNPEDDCVRKAANFVVEGKSLTGLVPVFKQILV